MANIVIRFDAQQFKRIFCLFLIQIFTCLFSLNGNAQTILQGTITDSVGNALEGIDVLVSKPEQNTILAFSITDSLGHFQVKLQSTSDSLEIRTNSLSYKDELYVVENKNQKLSFVLSPETKQLKQVVVRGAPVTRHGDTIDYSVYAFADQKDRVLADVLKKMPGIEVDQNGKIYYQGRPIQKYYIEGMDLLGGKYSLADNNLPYTSVSSVQILENFQPKKILQGKIPTNRTSLNVKLKKNVTATGTATAGAGLSPLLWDVNITPMIFSKKRQLIVSYQTNNTGNDVSKDLNTLTLEDLTSALENNMNRRENMLDIKALQRPDLNRSYYLFNNVHLINTNYLFKTKNEYQIRVNVSYLNDFQRNNGVINTTYFLPGDTLRMDEKIRNRFYFNSLRGNLTIEKNTSKMYLKNSLKIKSYWDSQKGEVTGDTSKINQNLKNPYHLVENKFQLILPVGKRFVTLSSVTSYSKEPQQLEVNPGQYDNILNSGAGFYGIKQYSDIGKLYAHNSIAMGFVKKRWKFNSKLGFQYLNQRLNTSLQKVVNGNSETLGLDFLNHLYLNRTKSYFQTNIYYETRKLKASLQLPFSLLLLKLHDSEHDKGQQVRKILTQPMLYVEYDRNAFWKFTVHASYHVHFGADNQVYYGYILKNYQLLQIKDIPIPETQTQEYSAKAEYSNPLNSLFANLGYDFSISKHNLILQNEVAANGAVVLSAKKYPNTQFEHRIYSYFSYYYSPKKITLSLESNVTYSQGKQIINGTISLIRNRIITAKPKINMRFLTWLNLEYKGRFSFYKTKINRGGKQVFSQFIHYLDLDFYPGKQHDIGLSYESNHISDSGQKNTNYFVNILYRYSFKKRKIDLEARWNNVLNQMKYESANISSYLFIQTSYDLRPSQFMVSVHFSF